MCNNECRVLVVLQCLFFYSRRGDTRLRATRPHFFRSENNNSHESGKGSFFFILVGAKPGFGLSDPIHEIEYYRRNTVICETGSETCQIQICVKINSTPRRPTHDTRYDTYLRVMLRSQKYCNPAVIMPVLPPQKRCAAYECRNTAFLGWQNRHYYCRITALR